MYVWIWMYIGYRYRDRTENRPRFIAESEQVQPSHTVI